MRWVYYSGWAAASLFLAVGGVALLNSQLPSSAVCLLAARVMIALAAEAREAAALGVSLDLFHER